MTAYCITEDINLDFEGMQFIPAGSTVMVDTDVYPLKGDLVAFDQKKRLTLKIYDNDFSKDFHFLGVARRIGIDL